jgi:hypothetical protein
MLREGISLAVTVGLYDNVGRVVGSDDGFVLGCTLGTREGWIEIVGISLGSGVSFEVGDALVVGKPEEESVFLQI